MLSINQLAWLANALVCTVRGSTKSGWANTLFHMAFHVGLQAGSWAVCEGAQDPGGFAAGGASKEDLEH